MKLFLYALMTTFFFVGCESYNRQDAGDIQEQQEREEQNPSLPEPDDAKPFPEKGGNAGNR